MQNLAPEQSGLKWLFFDLNSCFASVEQQENPRLRGRPVAVVPMLTDYTCAIAASYEAKAYGVKTGTSIRDAKAMCPGLTCVLARHDVYVRYHHQIVAEVVRHTPIFKVCSIDELSSRLPPNKQSREAVQVVATRIREGLWRNVGEAINCSIGVAPNAFLAKVATDMQKPHGFVVLEPGHLEDALFPLALTDLPGISRGIEARLGRAGITTIEELWNAGPKRARAIWGSVVGERFWYALHGYDLPDQPTTRGMVGHSRVLDPALRLPDAARLVARRLSLKAATRLRREGYLASKFALSVRRIDGEAWAREMAFSPSQNNAEILSAFDGLWAEMLPSLQPQRLLKVAVTLAGLVRPGEATGDLFTHRSQETARSNRLSAVIDNINGRFGSETVRVGVSPKTSAGYVGTKIAFTRVPELDEFME